MKTVFYNDFKNYSNGQMMDMNWSGANGFCFNDEGKVCIVYEKEKGYWCLPGGGKEADETPEQTFVREVKEEAQAEVEMETLKYFHYVYAGFFDEAGNKVVVKPQTHEANLQKICFRFICKLKNIQEFIPNKKTEDFVSEIDERKFVSLEDLPNYITWLKDSENGAESFEILKAKILKHQ